MDKSRIIRKSKKLPDEKTLISVKLPRQLKDDLTQLAEDNDVTITSVVLTLIDEFINGDDNVENNFQYVEKFESLLKQEKDLVKLREEVGDTFELGTDLWINIPYELENTRYLIKKLKEEM